jgi:ABC-type transport system substrate-binding protein
MLRDAGFNIEPKAWEYRRVIGTGPWMLGEMRPSVQISYDANPDYYISVQTPSGPQRLPLLDHFQYLIISEYAQIQAQFVAGAIHQFVPRNADITSVQGQVKDVQTISRRPGWLGVWHSMNKESNDGLFQDERARRAYSMALDRDGLIEAFGELSKLRSEGIEIESGWTTVNVPWGDGGMFWWLDPKRPDFGEHARWYQYNPSESKKLLDAVGYDDDPVDLNFVTARYGTTYDQFTEAQIPMLRDAGFNIEPKAWEYRRVIGTEEGRNLPGVFYNYNTPYTTVDEYVFNQYVSESERVSMVRRYATPELVDLVNKQRVEFDREARQEMIYNIQRLGSELMSAVPSVHSRFGGVDLQRPEVRNYAEFQTAGYGEPVEERMYYWFDV